LGLIIALQDYCNEELKEDEAHYKIVGCKENVGDYFSSTTNCGPCIFVITISWIPETLGESRFINYKGCLCSVPAISSGHREQCEEGINEIFEIHIVIHQSSTHIGTKKYHPKHGIHVDD
jgi:hypothetical protein